MDGRRPGNPRFPVKQGMKLRSMGLGRWRGRWGSRGWRRFEVGGAEAGDLGGGSELLELGLPLAQGRRKGEEEGSASLKKFRERDKRHSEATTVLTPRMAGTWLRSPKAMLDARQAA